MMTLKGKTINNQQGALYIAVTKRESMLFSGMIKPKLKFLKVCRRKSLKSINFIFLSF